MPIYLSAERKASAVLNTAVGGEIIETAPYFSATGYTDVGIKTNTATSEHVSKFVEVSAGYSLEPIGKITYQKSTYSNAKQTKLELTTLTTGLSNLFANQFDLIGNFNFPFNINTTFPPFIGYSSLFSKDIVSVVHSSTFATYWYVCTSDFATRTQIYTSGTWVDHVAHICETNSILLVSARRNNNYATSSDGNNFISRAITSGQPPSGIASNSSIFVFHMADGTGIIYTTPDGITLTSRGAQGYMNIDSSCAFGNGIFAIISSTSVAKISVDNGVNWVSKTLPETINWRSIRFDTTHNVFILAAENKNYFYTTINFDIFVKINLPFTLPTYASTEISEIRIGKIGNLTVINGYISKDLKVWIKPNVSNLYLRAVKIPPTYIFGDAVTTNVKTYELRSDLFYSPPNQTNALNVNAFVRTALD